MMLRLLRKLLTLDMLGAVLIFGALQTLTYGLAASLRGADAVYLLQTGCVALLICIGLSKARWNGIQAAAGMVALGGLGVWILGARLTAPLTVFGQAILSLIPQIVPAIREKTSLDFTAITEAWAVIAQASGALALRLQTWLMGIDRNVTINDALIRNMAWTLIVWLCAASMGWYAVRRRAIAALLPSALLLALVISYSERRVASLWLLIFILILLMGLWNYKNQTVQWEKLKVDYSDSIGYDIGQAVIILAVAVGTLMYITPSISWRTIRDYLRERNAAQNEAAEMLGVQQPAAAPRPTAVPALPREHLLNSSYAQSQKIVMTIRTGELPPVPDLTFIAAPARYYWRSVTYDRYMGAGWVTGNSLRETYSADTPLIPGLLEGYRLVHLHVQLEEPEGRIFWSGILFSLDIPFTAGWRVRPQSDLFADQSALLAADLYAATSSATSYKADVYVPRASLNALRVAGTNYPEAIRDRYLALPPSVPKRVRDLAQQITEGQTTPLAKAEAIETYLRATYPYDLEVPPPPEGRDVADYFLFDLQRGYCDYYATAMVVLARASGIPARFVSGYATGAYDAPNAQYVVRELNAHSWAEIYFPEIGWIEFEPTAGLPAIERVEEAEASDVTAPLVDDSASNLLTRFRLERVGFIVLPFLLVIMFGVLYLTVFERWWYVRWLKPAEAVERIYHRLYRLARPLAGERTRAETAHEFAEKLSNALTEMGLGSRFKKMFTASQNEIHALTALYHTALFRQIEIKKQDVLDSWRAWSKLRWQLWLTRSITSLRRIFHTTQQPQRSK